MIFQWDLRHHSSFAGLGIFSVKEMLGFNMFNADNNKIVFLNIKDVITCKMWIVNIAIENI